MNGAVGRVQSQDGTAIAFERKGDGPPLVFVVGAFNDRTTAAELAGALSNDFTTFTYDRRGRGDSGDTQPYALEREFEDLEAIVTEAGGSASVFGYSSGAILAIKAAGHGVPVKALVLYDTPLVIDTGAPRWSTDHEAALRELVAAGRRGDAVEYFQANLVGIPEHVIAQMSSAPFRPGLEAVAHTLVYEMVVLGDGLFRSPLVSQCQSPILAIAGETTGPWMVDTARAIGESAPGGDSLVLEGLGHDIDPVALAPVIRDFLTKAV